MGKQHGGRGWRLQIATTVRDARKKTHSSRLIAHSYKHWHHHTLAISLVLIVASFFVGAGAGYAFVGKGGYHRGPLPPVVKIQGGTVPASFSLARFIVRVHNQGSSNSCVGQTLSTIREITARERRFTPRAFSAGYIYDQVNGGSDNGTSYAAAFEVLRTQGDPTLKQFPHDGIDWWVQPDDAARQSASHHRVAGWRSIDPSDRFTISYEIAHGRPVAVAIPVDTTFYNQWSQASLQTVSAFNPATVKFWHSITAVAYDPVGITLLNSWGPDYGFHGLIRVTWGYLASISFGGSRAAVATLTSRAPLSHAWARGERPSPPNPLSLARARGNPFKPPFAREWTRGNLYKDSPSPAHGRGGWGVRAIA